MSKKTKTTVSMKQIKNESCSKLVMTKQDYISMLGLTVLFFVLVLINLGHNYAPETGMHFYSDGNHELIIDFGDYINIDHMDVFLGNFDNRKIALSAYNEVTKEWEVYNDGANITSVYDWNTIPMGYYLRYLGIVSMDNEAILNEITFYSSEGELLTPVNTDEYPLLFDEQDKHPDYVTSMDGTMFDEIYHGRTGYEILHKIPIYETTHPHFGKILIAIGIALFGMNPFGWRIMIALLGTIMVPVMYIFAKRISNNTFVAAATTALLVFDFMHFALSRISTIDIPVALFILLMYYFMYSYLVQTDKESKYAYKMLIFSGLSMSFACATKFTGIYAGAGLGIIFISYTLFHFPKKSWKKLLGLCVTFFMLVPFIIYTLAFIPIVDYTPKSNLLSKMYYDTLAMIDYHANQSATHYYSSPWYSWIIDGKPLMLAHDIAGDGKISSINVMGNPIIYWLIIPCLIFMLYRIIRKKDKTALFLLFAYVAQYAPWIPITRILFIYHYFAPSLFGILIIGYTFKLLCEKWPKAKYGIVAYLVAVVVLFIIFYPAISGLPVSQEYLFRLKWLPEWVITF